MSSWAKPGVKCVCISRHPSWDTAIYAGLIETPSIGSIYTVRAVFGGGILLEEIVNSFEVETAAAPDGEPLFGIFRFVPLVELDDDVALFVHHLDRVGEPA